jgi:hypothetical protein
MPQINTEFANPAGPLAISAVLDSGTWLWARLDNDQLEAWLGDYIWFSEFAEDAHRANCRRTRDELVVECALRDRHDLIRRAWARLARNSRGRR